MFKIKSIQGNRMTDLGLFRLEHFYIDMNTPSWYWFILFLAMDSSKIRPSPVTPRIVVARGYVL